MIYNNLFHNNPGYHKMPGILPFIGVFTTIPQTKIPHSSAGFIFLKIGENRGTVLLFSGFLFCDSDIDCLLHIDYLYFVMLSAVLSVQRPCDLLFGCEFYIARSKGYDVLG